VKLEFQNTFLDSLYRLRDYASGLGQKSGIEGYLEMIASVEKQKKA
jgi:hypothetical protein